MDGWTLQLGTICQFSSFPERFILPLTVKEAVEVWLPTEKVTVPESAFVTPLSVRLCVRPSAFITFISLFWSGTSWSFHRAWGASSCETRHWKWTSSPSKTTQLSKNVCMVTSASVWHNTYCSGMFWGLLFLMPSGSAENEQGLNRSNRETGKVLIWLLRQRTLCVTTREERGKTQDQCSK